jgi:hypothetical protein
MTRSASVSQLGPEFEDFLFAPIGADRNGMLLSVLSALARLDLDPWQEAAKLAGLPGETATRRLESLIAALPDGSSADRDPATIAARLIALLPRQPSPNLPPRQKLLKAGAATPPRVVIYMYVIFMIFALGAQWIATSRQLPAPVGNIHAPASSTVSPQVRPPISSQ